MKNKKTDALKEEADKPARTRRPPLSPLVTREKGLQPTTTFAVAEYFIRLKAKANK